MSLKTHSRYDNGWLRSGIAPTVTPNTDIGFCPEFKCTFGTVGGADTVYCWSEVTLTLQTRGKRMMVTV